ncbi:MAG: hypothetical protein ABI589_15745, partial [Burkholderiales bacterium]
MGKNFNEADRPILRIRTPRRVLQTILKTRHWRRNRIRASQEKASTTKQQLGRWSLVELAGFEPASASLLRAD